MALRCRACRRPRLSPTAPVLHYAKKNAGHKWLPAGSGWQPADRRAQLTAKPGSSPSNIHQHFSARVVARHRRQVARATQSQKIQVNPKFEMAAHCTPDRRRNAGICPENSRLPPGENAKPGRRFCRRSNKAAVRPAIVAD